MTFIRCYALLLLFNKSFTSKNPPDNCLKPPKTVSKQLSKGTLYCTPTASEIELSKLILGNFPSMDKVRLMNTGGEATMTAIRLARAYTKKKKIRRTLSFTFLTQS